MFYQLENTALLRLNMRVCLYVFNLISCAHFNVCDLVYNFAYQIQSDTIISLDEFFDKRILEAR